MPTGFDVTEPEPCTMTLSANCPAATGEKLAVTVVAAFITTTQVPVPEQPAPLQPANWNPAAGVAVSVTFVPALYDSVQSAPQAIPGGTELTLPEPLTTTVRVTGCGC